MRMIPLISFKQCAFFTILTIWLKSKLGFFKMIAKKAGYRFIVLAFNSLLTFGTYFCFDMPSVLQDKLTSYEPAPIFSNKTQNETKNISETCIDCLDISDDDYNLFYAIFAWTNALVVIGAGFLIDKLGNQVGAILFSFLCLSGTTIFAVGTMPVFRGTPAMFPVMLVGRLLFGSGNGALSVVQFRIGSYWFKNKELALAFGIILTVSRAGSVLNFFFTDDLVAVFGLTWTLFGGAMLCGISFISAIMVSSLDAYGVKQLGDKENLKAAARGMRISDVRNFSGPFWLLVLTIVFGYNGLIPFIADSSKFISQKYHQPPKIAAYISSAVYDVSMVISPFLGAFVDWFGRRGFLMVGCALFTVPVFGFFAFTDYINPLILTVWLGFMYSFLVASTWSAIPLVVRQANMGLAIGLTNSSQMLGIGFSNLVVGKILGENEGDSDSAEALERWKYVMIFLLSNTAASVVTGVLLNIFDKRRGGIINMNKEESLRIHRLITRSIQSETEPLLSDKDATIN